MPYKTALIVLLLFFFHESWGDPGAHVFRNQCVFVDSLATGNSELTSCDQEFVGYQRPSPLLKAFRLKQQQNKKIIATLLAFPLPFGIVGLHRIYLGSAPYVPVVYIASLGGMFGVLPFIDFCVLLASKKTDPYLNNEKIFMWVN